jgi:hypothetical protein
VSVRLAEVITVSTGSKLTDKSNGRKISLCYSFRKTRHIFVKHIWIQKAYRMSNLLNGMMYKE